MLVLISKPIPHHHIFTCIISFKSITWKPKIFEVIGGSGAHRFNDIMFAVLFRERSCAVARPFKTKLLLYPETETHL